VAAYVKRGKTDAADAAAICEAVTRSTMRFVPIKIAGRGSNGEDAPIKAVCRTSRTEGARG
jgi:transposase